MLRKFLPAAVAAMLLLGFVGDDARAEWVTKTTTRVYYDRYGHRVTETTSVTVWVDRTPIYVPPPKAVYVPPAPVKTTVTLYPSSWVSDLVFIDRTYGRRWVLTSDDIPTRRWTEIRGCYVENGDGTWSFSTNCLKYKFTGRVEGIR